MRVTPCLWELTPGGHGKGWRDMQRAVAFGQVTKVRGLAGGTAETAKVQRKQLLKEVVAALSTVHFVTAQDPQDQNCARQVSGQGSTVLALAFGHAMAGLSPRPPEFVPCRNARPHFSNTC